MRSIATIESVQEIVFNNRQNLTDGEFTKLMNNLKYLYEILHKNEESFHPKKILNHPIIKEVNFLHEIKEEGVDARPCISKFRQINGIYMIHKDFNYVIHGINIYSEIDLYKIGMRMIYACFRLLRTSDYHSMLYVLKMLLRIMIENNIHKNTVNELMIKLDRLYTIILQFDRSMEEILNYYIKKITGANWK